MILIYTQSYPVRPKLWISVAARLATGYFTTAIVMESVGESARRRIVVAIRRSDSLVIEPASRPSVEILCCRCSAQLLDVQSTSLRHCPPLKAETREQSMSATLSADTVTRQPSKESTERETIFIERYWFAFVTANYCILFAMLRQLWAEAKKNLKIWLQNGAFWSISG